jgi:RHS repeat-associated protein
MPSIMQPEQLLQTGNSSRRKMSKVLVVLLAALCCSLAALARQQDDGIEDNPQVQQLTGPSLLVNAAISTAFIPGTQTDKTIINIVSLRLKEETGLFIRNNFTATVKLKIEYGPDALNLNTINQQVLSVSYNREQRSKYNTENYIHFKGAEYVRVTVLEITPSTVGAINITDLLQVENEMRVTRYYTLGNNVQPTSFTTTTPSATDDELGVTWTWPTNAGHTHTQLEWTWLENDLASYYYANGNLNYDLLFRNKATRIDLPHNINSYQIPLLYGDTGKLYCRIRAVNIKKNGGRSDGPWSTPQSPSFSGHQINLNWQVATSFAEEGKRKAVIQYFDGSLRSRQTVTKDNVTNTTVTAETFYDGEGRPAIQILPVPGISTKIGYTPNLNLFEANTALGLNTPQAANTDPAAYFDLQPIATPTSITPALQIDSGAALYYSAANHEKNTGANSNIPDAEGYPYSVTRYTPDATGRIQSQSGLGAALQMGKGHETKYYYGTAAQEELDGLFGTEAGNYTHYFKNMVKDANGQMSVSYTDMHGRTIATALAGDAPTNMVPLSINATHYPNQAGTVITRNLLNSSTNTVKNNSIEAINTLLVPATTLHEFTYKLNPEKLQLLSCTGPAVCYDCMYNLEISITEESGDLPPIVRRYNNINLAADDDCTTGIQGFKDSTGTLIPNNTIIDTITLLPGAWTIRKTLTISEASLQLQKEAWLQKGLCKTEQQLVDSLKSVLEALTGCNTPAPPDTCTSCLTSQNLPTKRQLMLGDMMPNSGQYARGTGASSTFNTYDIFSTVNAGQPFFRNPLTGNQPGPYYYNSQGQIDPVQQVLSTITPDDFTSAFQYQWAEALLPRHPEYARLLFAESELTPSYNWIHNFLQTDTWAKAVDSNYILFTGNTTATPHNDPFYTEAPGYKSAMLTKVNDNYVSKDDITLSMWQIAYGGVRCKTLTNINQQKGCYLNAPKQPATTLPAPFDNLTTAEKDQVWLTFRSLYGNERERQVNEYIIVSVPLASSNQIVMDGYMLHFPTEAQMAQQFNGNGEWNWWPSTPGNPPNVLPGQGNASATQTYASRCDNYINNWRQALLQCPELAAHPNAAQIITAITTQMAAVCKKGSDAANPYGASDVAPGTSNDGSPRSFEQVINNVFATYGIPKNTLCNPYVIEFPKPYGKNPSFTPELVTTLDSCNCSRFTQLKNEAALAGYTPTVLSSLNQYFLATYNDTITATLYYAFDNCSQLGNQVFCHTVYDTIYHPCDMDFGCGLSLRSGSARTKKGANMPLSAVSVNQESEPLCPEGYHWSYQYNQCVEDDRPICLDGYHWDPEVGDCVPDIDNTCETYCPRSVCDTVYIFTIPLITPQPWPAFLKCGYTGGRRCLTCADLSSLTQAFKDSFDAPFDSAPVLTSGLTQEQISYNVLYQRFLNYRTGFQYNWLDYAQAAANAGCNLANLAGNTTATQNVICADIKPLNDTTGILLSNPPCQQAYNMAVTWAQQIYESRTQTLMADFEAAYRAKCLAAKDIEEFSVKYHVKEYHYSLYYYDIAGNLVKTVPPKGARPNFTDTFLLQVKNARVNLTEKTPSHLLVTDYRYNSLNQVTDQRSPDAGTSLFWYDRLGRMVVSRNAQQAAEDKYSYTRYDSLGRITEVGQKPQTTAMTQTISQDQAVLDNWILNAGGVREQITFTVYSQPYVFQNNTYLTQSNLRNRVSFTAIKKLATDTLHYSASFYTYDIHGNVDTLLQDFAGVPEMAAIDQRFKKIVYNYDLISGKVNMVSYQPGSYDAFYHRYQYDGANKLTIVETSRDKILWERDATYQYYKHGPLSRAVLGSQQVQGIDYAYTLQGWLKGINTTGISNVVLDMGQDGSIGGSNAVVARDALGFALHYYDATEGSNAWIDYKPIHGTSAFARPDATSGFVSLYNGNIGAISINNAGLNKGAPASTNADPLFYRYRYDQLNRIVSMQAYKGLNAATNQWTPIVMNDYKESVAYDPNGNILSYLRNGTPSTGKQAVMDSLTYYYDTNSNRLAYVDDSVSINAYAEDLNDQSPGNFTYDAIGNLKADVNAGITNITWNIYGKIVSIEKGSTVITYGYDAAGNRITKTADNITTIYVRDASGNVMSIYEKQGIMRLNQTELHVYGSSRLGITTPLSVASITTNLEGGFSPATISTFIRGGKVFEMSNHLGNVLATLTDRKLQHSTDSTLRDYYEADILTAADYYPFGMIMPGRSVTLVAGELYRYGFNGKENDNEVKGEGNQQDYGMRIYDPRLGRFLSVDPLTRQYSFYTPYQFAANSPILSVDIDGLEASDNKNKNETPTVPVNLWPDNEENKEFQQSDKCKELITKWNLRPGEIINKVNGTYIFSRESQTSDETSYWWYNTQEKAWIPFIPEVYVYPVDRNPLKTIFWDATLGNLMPIKDVDVYVSVAVKHKTKINKNVTLTTVMAGGQVGFTTQDDHGFYGSIIAGDASYISYKWKNPATGMESEVRMAPFRGLIGIPIGSGNGPIKYGEYSPQVRYIQDIATRGIVKFQAEAAVAGKTFSIRELNLSIGGRAKIETPSSIGVGKLKYDIPFSVEAVGGVRAQLQWPKIISIFFE